MSKFAQILVGMRPLFVINKGIQKAVTAVSRKFTVGSTYIANIYNPKYPSTKIQTSGVCALVNERNQVSFTFSDESTSKLKSGYATIEIYDIDLSHMIYRDNFAIIRDNSLRAESVSPDDPSMQFCTITFVNWDGAVLQRSMIEKGVMPEYTGATPTREAEGGTSYIFAGWDRSVVTATRDAVYRATYDEHAAVFHVVRFLNYDETLLLKLNVLHGQTPTYSGEEPTQPGDEFVTYNFVGWNPQIGPITEDTEYTAQYEATYNPYITYAFVNADTGTVIDGYYGRVLVNHTPSPVPPAPVKQDSGVNHYVFDRWDPVVGPITENTTFVPLYHTEVYTQLTAVNLNTTSGTDPCRYGDDGIYHLEDDYDSIFVGQHVRIVPIGGQGQTWYGRVSYKMNDGGQRPYLVRFENLDGTAINWDVIMSNFRTTNVYLEILEYYNYPVEFTLDRDSESDHEYNPPYIDAEKSYRFDADSSARLRVFLSVTDNGETDVMNLTEDIGPNSPFITGVSLADYLRSDEGLSQDAVITFHSLTLEDPNNQDEGVTYIVKITEITNGTE